MSELRVILPWPPRALSPNSRPPHWAVLAKAKRAYRSACHLEAIAAGWRNGAFAPTDRLHVGLVFVPPDRRRRDIDNLIAAMKSGLDGLADALGVDDSRWTLTCGVEDGIRGMVVVTICTLPGPQQPQLVAFEVAA